ncbi:MAG: uroporphyrinogen-III synthase [Desulfuromonadaceae bacterium]|jgi:uroporphyrinogen III methyltransferase/synthase|nr:uroporphyrinogen-III synthase [Desulfuromonadaceae bacterium]
MKAPQGTASAEMFAPCVLVTRPLHQAQQLVSALEQAGLDTAVFPLIEIVPSAQPHILEAALTQLNIYDVLLFTSVNAVNIVMQHIEDHGIAVPKTLRFVSVGPATQHCLRRWGHSSIAPATDYTAEGVLKLLNSAGVARQRVLYPRAEQARELIVPGLRECGAQVDAPVAYRTVATTGKANALFDLLEQRVDIVTFTSSSAVHNYAALLGPQLAQVPIRVQYASIGPITSATMQEYALPCTFEAWPYTIPGLIDAILAEPLVAQRLGKSPNMNPTANPNTGV